MNPAIPLINPLGPQIGGVPYSLAVILFFIIEGLAYFLAVAYFIHRFAMDGRRYTLDLSRWLESGVIDRLYHESLPEAVSSMFHKFFEEFEIPVLDRGYNEKLVAGMLSIGELLSKIQTERINHYLIAFCFGILLSLAVVLGVLL